MRRNLSGLVVLAWAATLEAQEPLRLWSIATPSTDQTLLKLRQELGKGFEVATTRQHFIVAQPAGQTGSWSSRFEEIYGAFYLYFSVRGIKMSPPKEPLVVIVFANQQDFLHYAQADGGPVSRQVLGYYSPLTNRVAMFDVNSSHSGRGGVDWSENDGTLIHELAHQVAFNTGVHSIDAPPPRWLAEGLGMLFEARGVWKSRSFAKLSDRVHRGRLNEYRRYAAQDKPGVVAEMINSDRLFQSEPNKAYAYAWALTFYLTETQPQRYSDYLQRTAQLSASNGAERLKQFTSAFGQKLDLIEAKFTRFMKELKDK